MNNIHNSWNELFEEHVFRLDELYNSNEPIYPGK